jgi:hypothetical protein
MSNLEKQSPYIQLNFENFENIQLDEINSAESETKSVVDKMSSEKSNNKGEISYYLDSLTQKIDSTNLEQVYSDDTRGIQLKFPVGWKYLDQKLNNKLDGVTFWFEEQNLEHPPFVHLFIVDKSLFSENRFASKIEFSDVVWYFNSPEIINDYVSFEIYIQSKMDYDIKIKISVKGEENFYKLQPKFLGMVRSLQFRNGFFNFIN